MTELTYVGASSLLTKTSGPLHAAKDPRAGTRTQRPVGRYREALTQGLAIKDMGKPKSTIDESQLEIGGIDTEPILAAKFDCHIAFVPGRFSEKRFHIAAMQPLG